MHKKSFNKTYENQKRIKKISVKNGFIQSGYYDPKKKRFVRIKKSKYYTFLKRRANKKTRRSNHEFLANKNNNYRRQFDIKLNYY